MKKREEKLGEAPSPKEGDEVELELLADVDLKRFLAMLWRGGGSSMLREEGELLHAWVRERERERC